MTFSSYLEHSAPIFKSLELLPIEKVFINRVAIVMFKISCDMLPKTMAKLYSKKKDYMPMIPEVRISYVFRQVQFFFI